MPKSLYAERSSVNGGCQSSLGIQRQPSPKPLLDGPVSHRFGGHGLQHGFVPIPAGLRQHSVALQLTPALEQTIVALIGCGRGQVVAQVTIAELAGRLGLRERATQARIARLVALGHLRKIRHADSTGADLPNDYDLRPLWLRIDELDTEQAPGRVQPTTPLIDRDLRDLDSIKDPPTPIATPTRPKVRRGHALSPLQDASSVNEWHYVIPRETSLSGDDTARNAVACAVQSVANAYHEAYPAAAIGQFLGLQQRYSLKPAVFIEALHRAKQRVDERVAAGELGRIQQPVAYLYTVLAKDLAQQQAASAAIEPTEPSVDERLHSAAARLAVDLGDPQPSSAASRIMRLFRRSDRPLQAFMTAMQEAARQTRQCDIQVTHSTGTANALPLFLTILNRLLRCGGSTQPQRKRQYGSHTINDSHSTPSMQHVSELHPVWREVLETLQGTLAPDPFARCLTSRAIDQVGNELRIAVPGVFEQQWFARQLGRRVNEALAEHGHDGVQVVYVVEGSTDEVAV